MDISVHDLDIMFGIVALHYTLLHNSALQYNTTVQYTTLEHSSTVHARLYLVRIFTLLGTVSGGNISASRCLHRQITAVV